jgi:hypothetical protein
MPISRTSSVCASTASFTFCICLMISVFDYIFDIDALGI